jgi:hypothetical protein
MLRQFKPGDVVAFIPDDTAKSKRGIKLSVSRVAASLGQSIRWLPDQGEELVFQVEEKK